VNAAESGGARSAQSRRNMSSERASNVETNVKNARFNIAGYVHPAKVAIASHTTKALIIVTANGVLPHPFLGEAVTQMHS